MVLLLFALFRAGFEPLSCRGTHGPSLRIEGLPVFSWGGITIHAAAQNRRGLAAKRTQPLARRVFRPTVPGSSAHSPRRRFAYARFPRGATASTNSPPSNTAAPIP